MKKILLILLLALQASAQQEVIKTPEMSDIHKFKIQALFYKYSSLDQQQTNLKLQWEKLDQQKAQLSAEINALTDEIYKEDKVDKEEWGISGEGAYVPKPSTPKKPLDQVKGK